MANPPANESQQVLPPDDVVAQLSPAATAQTPDAAPPSPPAPLAGVHERKTRRVDFRPPSFLSSGELRQLRQRHEEFIRALITRLSVYLRMEIGACVLDMKTLPYRRFLERLATPTHLTLFRIESFNGMALLDIAPALGLALVDRLLGGPGKPANLEREFSEIESDVLDIAVQLVLKEWCQEVIRHPDARPQVVSHESNPRYLPWSDPDANVLLVTLSLTLNETTGEIQLGVPGAMIEPVQRQLNTALDLKAVAAAPQPSASTPWHPHLNEVPVPLNASWAGLDITARELASLRVGDVLQIAPHQLNRVQVCVGRVPKFYGRLGTCEQTWAIELTGLL